MEPATLTAPEIAEVIRVKLAPHFGKMTFKSEQGAHLGPHDSVYVTYASVPQGSPEIDAMNARSNPMFVIEGAPGHPWMRDKHAPASVTVRMFRGRIDHEYGDWKPGSMPGKAKKITFRAKTGTPDVIVKYLTDFFMKNKDAMLRNNR